jgi:anti-anti-sigma factor
VLQRGCRSLVLDVADVRYVDSWGLGELTQVNAAAHTRGATLKLLHVNRWVADLLRLTRLDAVFERVDDDGGAATLQPAPTLRKTGTQ